jgi:dTDP-4-dehydrorhamnose reductase
VFDGASEDPYLESDTTNPVQVYGQSKLAGEQAVGEASTEALVLRLSFVWGVHRSSGELTGFPAWVRGRFESGEPTSLFTDQRVTPSRAGQVADTIFDLLDAEATGAIHVASRSCVTPYEFGDLICRQMGAPTGFLEEGSMDDVDREATRPVNTCLDVHYLEESLGREQPTLEADLRAVESAFDSP